MNKTQTFIVTVKSGGMNAQDLVGKLVDGFGEYQPARLTAVEAKPREVVSYRDPDLSDKWLSEADWRAENDRTRKFRAVDAGRIIKRLTFEVRKLNRMLNR